MLVVTVMLVFMDGHAGIYGVLVFTVDAGIYSRCNVGVPFVPKLINLMKFRNLMTFRKAYWYFESYWYLRFMLVFMDGHAGSYGHAGIYGAGIYS